MKREEKIKASKELSEELKKWKTIGFVNMFKMPTAEYKEIKSKLSEKSKMKFYKKSIILHALEALGLKEKMENLIPQQTVIIFSNEDPFELFSFINSLKAVTYAKEGDIAPEDIIVKAGPTPLSPGPVISEFAKLRIPTGVEKGKIAIKKDTVVVKKGEIITKEVASILQKLGIKPIKIGLDVAFFYYNGNIIGKEILNLVLQYPEMLVRAYQNALNLSVNIGYPTKENIKILISNAYAKAKALNRLVGGA